jgi:hypothetical protein
MTISLDEKLNQTLARITSKEFLESKGLGNEIAFYIFDYPPEEELKIREQIVFLLKELKNHHNLSVLHINLFELMVEYLKDRKIFDKSIDLEVKQGSCELEKALKAPLKMENFVRFLQSKHSPATFDMVFISGVGNAYPLIRSHALLNNLQTVMEDTPMILFYPGVYDRQTLKLFGKLESNNYYRAFQLIS